MKFLGIDFGSKRVGLAVSDEEGRIAFPKETLRNDLKLLENILDFIKKEKIEKIVIGESVDSKGEKNLIEEESKLFLEELAKLSDIKVEKQKEFFSSYEAHGRMGKEQNNARSSFFSKTKDLDASSATIILQRYLDKVNNLKK